MTSKKSVYIGSKEVSYSNPCIVANVRSVEEAIKAESQGADIVEVRCDVFNSSDPHAVKTEVEKIRRSVDVPLFATVRRVQDGGSWFYKFKGNEQSRLNIFRAVFPYVHGVDIELDADIRDEVVKEARTKGLTVILSYHNFVKTDEPEEINRKMAQMHNSECDILKFAYMATRSEDPQRLREILVRYVEDRGYEKPLAVISMGSLGEYSRVLFPLLGSCMTYGYIKNGEPQAPGQIPVPQLVELLRPFKEDIPISLSSEEGISKLERIVDQLEGIATKI